MAKEIPIRHVESCLPLLVSHIWFQGHSSIRYCNRDKQCAPFAGCQWLSKAWNGHRPGLFFYE
jgi:hypothetical protein